MGYLHLRGCPEGPWKPWLLEEPQPAKTKVFYCLNFVNLLYLGKNKKHASSQSLANLHPQKKESEGLLKAENGVAQASMKLSGVPVNWLHSWGRGEVAGGGGWGVGGGTCLEPLGHLPA